MNIETDFCFGDTCGLERYASGTINDEWRTVLIDSKLAMLCIAYYNKLPFDERGEFRTFLSTKFLLTDGEKRSLL